MRYFATGLFFVLACTNSSEPAGVTDGGPGFDGGPMDAPVLLWDAIPTTCDWPFEITERGGRTLCMDLHLRGPGCDGLPEDFPLDNSRPGLPPTHWITGSCIPVTVHPELGRDFALVEEAVEIWNNIECLTLCYEAPVVSSRAVDFVRRERRVHIIGRRNEPTSTHFISPETGRLAAHQSEFIGRPVDAPRTVGGALAALVAGAGFRRVPMGQFQTVNAYDQPAEELTESDVEGLCFLYGDPPYCDADLRTP
jgi:hypothetical protein